MQPEVASCACANIPVGGQARRVSASVSIIIGPPVAFDWPLPLRILHLHDVGTPLLTIARTAASTPRLPPVIPALCVSRTHLIADREVKVAAALIQIGREVAADPLVRPRPVIPITSVHVFAVHSKSHGPRAGDVVLDLDGEVRAGVGVVGALDQCHAVPEVVEGEVAVVDGLVSLFEYVQRAALDARNAEALVAAAALADARLRASPTILSDVFIVPTPIHLDELRDAARNLLVRTAGEVGQIDAAGDSGPRMIAPFLWPLDASPTDEGALGYACFVGGTADGGEELERIGVVHPHLLGAGVSQPAHDVVSTRIESAFGIQKANSVTELE